VLANVFNRLPGVSGDVMKRLSHLLMTVILVTLCGYASRGSVIAATEGLMIDGHLTAAPNLGDLLVHVVRPLTGTPILPSTFPLPGQKTLNLHVTACRGEFEPASFVIRPTTNVTRLKLTPTSLQSDTRVIPAENVDIKIVKAWYQGGSAWVNINPDPKRMLVPELLLNDDALVQIKDNSQDNFLRLSFSNGPKYALISDATLNEKPVYHSVNEFPVKDAITLLPVDIEKDTNKQFWITVKVPRDASAGKYSGQILFSQDDTKIGKLNIAVDVLPFELDAPRQIYSIYYRGQLQPDKPTISSEYKSAEQMTAELKDMQAHGISNPTVYQYFGHSRIAEALIKDALKLRSDVGFTADTLYFLGMNTGISSTTTERAELAQRVRQLIELARPFGIKDVYIYGIDEAEGEKLLAQRKAWEAVHEAGAKIYVAGRTGNFHKVGDVLDLLVAAYEPNKEEADKYHNIGHQVFNYANPQVGVENPEAYRRNYGLLLWQNDYDGAMDYAYQHSFGSIWNDFDGKYRDHVFAYPTTNGVIDTIAWEGFREGVDDVRYVTTLQKRIKRAMQTGTPQQRNTAKEAQEFLDRLKSLPSGSLDINDAREKMTRYITLLL
jgi:hypothetical protein